MENLILDELKRLPGQCLVYFMIYGKLSDSDRIILSWQVVAGVRTPQKQCLLYRLIEFGTWNPIYHHDSVTDPKVDHCRDKLVEFKALYILLTTIHRCKAQGSVTESAIYAMMELVKYGGFDTPFKCITAYSGTDDARSRILGTIYTSTHGREMAFQTQSIKYTCHRLVCIGVSDSVYWHPLVCRSRARAVNVLWNVHGEPQGQEMSTFYLEADDRAGKTWWASSDQMLSTQILTVPVDNSRSIVTTNDLLAALSRALTHSENIAHMQNATATLAELTQHGSSLVPSLH